MGILAVACTPKVPRNPFFDALPPAQVIALQHDSVVVNVSDLFPLLEHVDTVVASHLEVRPVSSWDTLLVCAVHDGPMVTTLQIDWDDQRASVPVKIPDTSYRPAESLAQNLTPQSGAPRLDLMASDPKTDALCSVHVGHLPATLLVFWQNTCVETVEMTAPDSPYYHVRLPGYTALQERSYVRIFAYNEHGFANDLLIPLKDGRVQAATQAVLPAHNTTCYE